MPTISNQSKSKSIHQLPKGKSIRRFGKDLTNCYNLQTNTNFSQHQSSCFTFMHYGKNKYNLQSPEKFSVCSQNIFEGQIMANDIAKNPLEDHYQDIMSYTLDQSFSTCIQEDFLHWHSQINEQIREILISWMIKLQTQFKLQHSTLCLAVYLVDRYCYQQSIMKNKYQLLGVACLFLAAKYEELATPRINKFIEICAGIYTRKDIVNMESQVLECVGFNVNKIVLLREIAFNRIEDVFRTKNEINLDGIDQEVEGMSVEQKLVLTRCEYFLELILIQYKLTLLQPHYLSAVLVYVSCKMQNIQTINSRYVIDKYSLSQKMFKDYFQMFLSVIKRRNEPKFKEVNKKYQNLRNSEL